MEEDGDLVRYTDVEVTGIIDEAVVISDPSPERCNAKKGSQNLVWKKKKL